MWSWVPETTIPSEATLSSVYIEKIELPLLATESMLTLRDYLQPLLNIQIFHLSLSFSAHSITEDFAQVIFLLYLGIAWY